MFIDLLVLQKYMNCNQTIASDQCQLCEIAREEYHTHHTYISRCGFLIVFVVDTCCGIHFFSHVARYFLFFTNRQKLNLHLTQSTFYSSKQSVKNLSQFALATTTTTSYIDISRGVVASNVQAIYILLHDKIFTFRWKILQMAKSIINPRLRLLLRD